MIRSSRMMWLVVLAATVALAFSQVAVAQPGEGRGEGRGRGGPGGRDGRAFGGFAGSPIRLVSDKNVQKALKLTDEQKTQIDEINEQFRDDFRKLLQDGADRDAMEKMTKGVADKLNEVLDDDQEKRLRGITIQVRGPNVLLGDAELAKELNITDEQKSDLEKAQEENMRTMREAFSEIRELDRDEQRAKFEELRKEANKKLLAVLNSEQQEQLEALKGEKVNIDLSQMSGPGGRSGFEARGTRGERGRGERGRGGRDRDRDSESSESKSESESN